jgi:hypothetical protein
MPAARGITAALADGDGSFCFFFQKEALSYFCVRASGSFLKKRTKKLSSVLAFHREMSILKPVASGEYGSSILLLSPRWRKLRGPRSSGRLLCQE